MQKTLKYLVTFILFLIPAFSLIVANTYFFPFITGKAFYFRILVELAFAGWTILAFLDARYRPRLNPVTIAISIFALVALAADLLGVNPLRSIWSNFERMEGWLVIIHLWAFFIVTSCMFGYGDEGRRNWHRWLNMNLGIAGVVALYGFFQLFGWAVIHQGSSRIDASLGNAAYMAVYMLMNTFIAAYMFFAVRRYGRASVAAQWFYGIASIVFGFMLFQTATRGTILGLIGAVILSLAIYAVFGKGEKGKWRLVSAAIIVAIIVIGIIFWLNRDAQFVKNSEVLNRMASISISETRTQARGYVWPMAIEGFKERPILGWGQENFNYVFNSHYNPEMWSHEQWFDRAHNVYLDWLVAGGILGFLAYLSLYIFAIISIWKSQLSIAEKSALIGLVAGYAVHNIFVFDNLASYVMFVAVLGFVNSFKEGKQIKILGIEPVRLDAVQYIVAPIAIVLLVASLYFVNVRPIQANTRLIEALQACANGKPDMSLFESALTPQSYMANQEVREQLITCTNNVLLGQYPPETKQNFFTFTVDQINKQIENTPNDTRVYTLSGYLFNAIGQSEAAERNLEKAYELSPKKQSIGLPLVNSYATQGKFDEAISILDEMYKAVPSHPGVRDAYARVLVLEGKESEARSIFGDDPLLFESQSMAQIYAVNKNYSKAISIYRNLIATDPANVQLKVELAQIQNMAGQKSQAIATLRGISSEYPEYKVQIDAMIAEIQK